MVSVRINGRLGNQMFQYAFAYSLARQHRSILFLRGFESEEFVVPNYFLLRPYENLKLKFARYLYPVVRRILPSHSLEQTGWDDAGDILRKATKFHNPDWAGFFQSVEYFKSHEEEVRSLFTLKSEVTEPFLKKYGDILNGKKKIAVIHIRRTDYLEWGTPALGGINLSLPMDYYEKCINLLNGLQEYHTIVLSDDVGFVKEYFKSRPSFHFEANSEIIDFQLIMHADLLVISNSTFAWWGAYLNKKKATVMAPEFWLGFKVHKPYPTDIKKGLPWTWVYI